MASSIYPLTVNLNTAGTLTAVSVVLGGSGYVESEPVTLTGSGTGATGTVSVTAGAVTAVTVVAAGTNYISGETLSIISALSGTGATGTATTTTITSNSDILSSDVTINDDQLVPGGGGILRLSFSFIFGTSPATVSIFNNGILKGNLNADNSSNVISNGYYRFDIDVEGGDSINLRASQSVNAIHFVRAHCVLLGA